MKFPFIIIMQILAFKYIRNTEDEELATQLDVFDAEFVVDEEMMVAEEGLDISNHKNVFRAVHTKVRWWPIHTVDIYVQGM